MVTTDKSRAFQDDLMRYRGQFFQLLKHYVGLFKSIFLRIFEYYQERIGKKMIKLQSDYIYDPIGIQRIQITETLINFLEIMDPSASGFDEDELINLLHILFIWLIEKRHNSIYISKMTKLMNILKSPKMSVTFVNVLIKLNMISIFHEIYFKIFLNGVFQTKLGVDEIHIFIKVFVFKVKEAIKVTKNAQIKQAFETMMTWRELKDEIKARQVHIKENSTQQGGGVSKIPNTPFFRNMTVQYETKKHKNEDYLKLNNNDDSGDSEDEAINAQIVSKKKFGEYMEED